MIKEIETTEKEFLGFFKELDKVWFHRYYQTALTSYFELDKWCYPIDYSWSTCE